MTRWDESNLHARLVTLAVILLWCVLPSRAARGDANGDAAFVPAGKESRVPALSWVPPPDDFDWVQLRSGEWLKGRIKAMQERSLEFDSEELDVLTIDWKKIRQLRSARTFDVLFVGGKKVNGLVVVTPDTVSVTAPTESKTMSRENLQSLTPAGSKEREYWSGKLSLGYTLRTGNTEQVDFTTQTHLQRRTPATRVSLDYIGNVSSLAGIESANNHRANTEFDLWLSRRLYLIVPFAEYFRDPFQNVADRYTLGAGVGYDLVDRANLKWNVATGPGFQQAHFASTQGDEATVKKSTALIFSSRFDWEMTQRIEWILEYRGQFTSKAIGESTHHSVSTLSVELTKRFDLDVSLVWDRIDNPSANSEGVQPLPDDFRLVVGIGLDF